MFEIYAKRIFGDYREPEDYSLLKLACLADRRDWFTLYQIQASKKFQKKSHIRVITFFVLLRIYIMKGRIYAVLFF